ncbi:hypothetical protein BH10ACT1_BH10ACT1_20380 [soil metagenome]
MAVDESDDIRAVERELALLVRRLEQVRRNLVVDGVALDRASYLLLDRIDLLGSPTAAVLVDLLQLDHSTVTRQVGTLERDGFVERVPGPDGGRAQVLELTESGAHLLAGARQGRHERVSRTLSDWTDRDRRSLGRLLGRLNEAFARRAVELRDEADRAGRPAPSRPDGS